jgi:hypothetical protein
MNGFSRFGFHRSLLPFQIRLLIVGRDTNITDYPCLGLGGLSSVASVMAQRCVLTWATPFAAPSDGRFRDERLGAGLLGQWLVKVIIASFIVGVIVVSS